MKVSRTIISLIHSIDIQSKTRRKLTKIIWLLIDKDHVLEKQIPNVSFTLKNVKKYRRHCCAISLCILMASQVAIKAALTNSGGFLRLETRKYTKLHLNALFSVQFARLVPTGLFHPSVPAGKCISIIFRTIFLFALTSLPFLRHYLPFGKKTRGIFRDATYSFEEFSRDGFFRLREICPFQLLNSPQIPLTVCLSPRQDRLRCASTRKKWPVKYGKFTIYW